ncbi:MAG: prepilin-type N-terminal cleavage/methylation domain-containing protein [Candidatus Hydrogenedentota bacterium]
MTGISRRALRRHRGISGLSLLEMLVATLIFSILMLGFTSLFRFSITAWFNAVGRFGNIQNLAGAFDIIASDLRSALPPYDTCSDIYLLGQDEGSTVDPDLTNSIQDELVFHCPTYTSKEGQFNSPNGQQWSAAARIGNELAKRGYWMRRDSTNDTILMQGRDVADTSDYCPEITYGFSIFDEFAYSVSKFNVEYYDGATWLDDWSTNTQGKLPKLVRVTLQSTKSGAAMTMAYVVHPRAQGTYITQ